MTREIVVSEDLRIINPNRIDQDGLNWQMLNEFTNYRISQAWLIEKNCFESLTVLSLVFKILHIEALIDDTTNVLKLASNLKGEKFLGILLFLQELLYI